MKRILSLTLIIVILFLNISSVLAEGSQKTVIIILDELDFETSKDIRSEKYSMGLLNIKTLGINPESLFMSINSGRKVSIPDGIFKGIRRKNERAEIENYKEVKLSLDKSYPNLSKNISFLGETLSKNNIKTSYMGDKDKSEAFIIADENGLIDKWEEETPYDLDILKGRTKEMLKSSDVLLISFDTDKDKKKISILSKFLDDMDDYNVIVFPKNVSGDVRYRLNDSIVPMMFKTNQKSNKDVGLLTSKSTKREGIVSSLDLFPTIASNYNLSIESKIGNNREILDQGNLETNLIETNQNILLEFLNLNLIKYIFHGLITALSAYIALLYFKGRKNFKRARVLVSWIITSIPISIILGFFNIHRFIGLYVFILISLSFLMSTYLSKKSSKSLELISIVTNILIFTSVFLYPKIIYNSYIGYNSIVAGGRFYGFNNEIMGVFIVTSIITYYYFKDKIKGKTMSVMFLLAYFLLVIMALTGGYGANFGGLLTGIALFLILIYLLICNRKMDKRTMFSLLAIGGLILVWNLYLDMKNETGSHAGNLIERVSILGGFELVDMIIKKVKQLLYMMVVPPWSVGFLSQIYLISSRLKDMKKEVKPISLKFIVMFITSFIVLLVNDTGVVAFVYMNTYLISNILKER